MQIETPNKTDHEIEAKRYKFSLVSDIDIENFPVFNVELKFFITIFNFSQFHEHNFLKVTE